MSKRSDPTKPRKSSVFTKLQRRDGIFKLLRSPGIGSNESIPPAFVAWRAGTTTHSLMWIQIRNLFDHGSGIRDGKIRIWDPG